MPKNIILDTSVLVALLSVRDNHHTWVKTTVAAIATPFLTCEAVFTETCFLARANELQSFFNRMIITLVQLNLVKKSLAVIISIFMKGFKTNKS